MTAVYYDPVAELVVVGCAIDNPHASDLAHRRLTDAQFFDPALAALFTVTPDLPIVTPDHAADPSQPLLWQTRAQQAARLTGLPHAQVLTLLQQRPVMHDLNGYYAERVKTAALLRQHRAELVEAIQDLDDGYLLIYSRRITRLSASTP